MTNPVARESTVYFTTGPDGQSAPAYRKVLTYCPGCETAHGFTVEVFTRPDGTLYSARSKGQPEPVWGWDGNLERPTFNPSMLAYYTVHLCPPDYVHLVECDSDDWSCGHKGHGRAWRLADGTLHSYKIYEEMPEGAVEVSTTGLPHAVDPPFGNCHSFLKDGQWQFLGDCAHGLAGQTVPMVPLPDWLMPSTSDEDD